MQYFSYQGFCMVPHGGKLPQGAVLVSEPFDPLVFLVARDPNTSRGLFGIHALAELDEPEGAGLLLPPIGEAGDSALARFVLAHGASVANTVFSRWFDVLCAFRARGQRRAGAASPEKQNGRRVRRPSEMVPRRGVEPLRRLRR